MRAIPPAVKKGWESRKGAIVFTTVNEQNIPNAIYASCVKLYDDHTILIADNYFSKTRQNINTNSTASLLFITEDNTAYQIKGSIQYHVRGRYFNDMKQWNPEKLPGHAVAIIKIKEVYSGAKRL